MEQNVDLSAMNTEILSKLFRRAHKRAATRTEPFKSLFDSYTERMRQKIQEEEQEKRRRLASILHKLFSGILLTSDELQFLKCHAPLYYNQALAQQRMRNIEDTTNSIRPISAVSEIKPL